MAYNSDTGMACARMRSGVTASPVWQLEVCFVGERSNLTRAPTEARSPQGRHVASWGLIFPLAGSLLSSGATSCGDQSASLNPLHAVRESGAPRALGLLAATSDLAAGPSVSEPPTGSLPAIFAGFPTREST